MKHYRLPSNHDLFLDRTLDEHLVDMFTTIFEEKPLEMHRQQDGEIVITNSGDYYVDKWEQELASGHVPDLFEAFAPEEVNRIKSRLDKARFQRLEGRGMTFGQAADMASKVNPQQQGSQSVTRKTFGD